MRASCALPTSFRSAIPCSPRRTSLVIKGSRNLHGVRTRRTRRVKKTGALRAQLVGSAAAVPSASDESAADGLYEVCGVKNRGFWSDVSVLKGDLDIYKGIERCGRPSGGN